MAVRWRYLVTALVGLAAALPVYHRFSPHASDYYVFVYGGRAIFGFMPGYHAGALHLYAVDPVIQIGPPTLLLAGFLQKIAAHQSMLIWSILVGLCGLGTVRASELTARARGVPPAVAASGALIGGSVLMAGWSSLFQFFHLEDAVAVTCIAGSYAAIVRGRRWWLVALMLGFAAACKPWAAIGFALIAAVPARRRVPALAVSAALAIVWWLPFIVAAPSTVHAVSSIPSSIFTSSPWAALHWPHASAPPGFRFLQFGFATLLGLLAIVRGRGDRAVAVIFAGRMLLDPRFYPYYAVGPLAGALIWDLTSRRRLPVWTAFTATCELVVPLVAPNAVVGWSTTVWSVTVIVCALVAPVRAAAPSAALPASRRGLDTPASPMFNPVARRHLP